MIDHGDGDHDDGAADLYLSDDEFALVWPPVVYLSKEDGEDLVTMAGNGPAYVTIGPDVQADKIGEYETGLGLRVHDVLQTDAHMKHYDALPISMDESSTAVLETVEWAEASANRDHLFVCLSSGDAIVVYDISDPFDKITLVTRLDISCKQAAYRDYHMLDFEQNGDWYTTVIEVSHAAGEFLLEPTIIYSYHISKTFDIKKSYSVCKADRGAV